MCFGFKTPLPFTDFAQVSSSSWASVSSSIKWGLDHIVWWWPRKLIYIYKVLRKGFTHHWHSTNGSSDYRFPHPSIHDGYLPHPHLFSILSCPQFPSKQFPMAPNVSDRKLLQKLLLVFKAAPESKAILFSYSTSRRELVAESLPTASAEQSFQEFKKRLRHLLLEKWA